MTKEQLIRDRWEGEVLCTVRNPDGSVDRQFRGHNILTDEGVDHILDQLFQTTSLSHYVGLTDGTPTVAAGDTMSSHAGWAEVTNYDEAARPGYTAGAAASGSVDNSGSVAQVTINATVTVGGAFLVTDNTKGGTTGVLLAVVAFDGGDESLTSGQVLEITYTVTMADDGT